MYEAQPQLTVGATDKYETTQYSKLMQRATRPQKIFHSQTDIFNIGDNIINTTVYIVRDRHVQGVNKKDRFCLPVCFLNNVYVEKRSQVYDCSESDFSVAKFRQECRKKSGATESSKYS